MSDIAITKDRPAIDLSMHTMEDGTVVNTKERIYTSNVYFHCIINKAKCVTFKQR